MKYFLRLGDDYLEDAIAYTSRAAAVADFAYRARELACYGQALEATLHRADTAETLAEYPDFLLSLGPRGGVQVTPV